MRPAAAGHDQSFRIEKIDATTRLELFEELANLHANSIHGGIMEALGPDFLASFYRQLSKGDEVLMYAARRDHKTIGFVAGSVNVMRSLRNIGVIGFAKLAIAGGSNAWQPRLFRAALQTIGYFFRRTEGRIVGTSKEASDPARAELLAIAVAEEARGQGVGKSLVNALEQELQSHGRRRGYFVSTNEDEIGSNAFYRATGFTFVGQKRHHDLMLNVYKKDFEQCSN
jgi:ribosomal protein S18 acetylase RimI-like enzyme